MSRCYVCDYSPTAPSTYQGGLFLYGKKPTLTYDKKMDAHICSLCKGSVLAAQVEVTDGPSNPEKD